MIEIHVDRSIYSDECISKAAYSLADNYIVERICLSGREELIKVYSKNVKKDEVIKADFFSSLNDYKLRDIIEKETHDIRTILYAKAFSECDNISEKDLQ